MLSIVKDKDKDFEEESFEKKNKDNDACPPPPDWMTFEAKMEWLRAAPDLFKKGRLIGGNVSLLENYCIAIGIVRECEAMLNMDGKIVGGKTHPAVKIMFDAMSQAKSIASELRFGKEIISEEDKTKSNGWEPGLLA